MLICGIDEAGYGPKLGPLVVGLSICKTHNNTIDINRALSEFPVKICDSKKIYSPSRGISGLERAVLSVSGYKTKKELKNLVFNGATVPDVTIPVSPGVIPDLGKELARLALDIKLISYVAGVEEFNREVILRSKHDYVFKLFCRLIKYVLDEFDDDIAVFNCGKLSYRRYYMKGLTEYLGLPFRILGETHMTSSYQHKNTFINFLLNAEDRSKPVALASMLAKYLRELYMLEFNTKWSEKYDIKPTSGYGSDARRFIKDLKQRVGNAQDEIVRLK